MAFHYGIGTGRDQAVRDVLPQIQIADELGFDHITFIDTPLLARDVITSIVFAAMNSSRLRIGPGIMQLATWDPIVIANALATIDELSGGRVIVGLGTGGSSIALSGRRPAKLAELEATVQFVRTLSSGGTVTQNGTSFRSEWMKRRMPVFLAADGPNALSMAAKIGDGAFTIGASPGLLGWKRSIVDKGLAKANRSEASFELWCRTMILIDEDLERARDQVRSYAATCAHFTHMSCLRSDSEASNELRAKLSPTIVDEIAKVSAAYDWEGHELRNAKHASLVSDELIDAFVICGPASRCAEQLAAMQEAGINRLSMALMDQPNKNQMLETFVKKVLPGLK